MIACRTRVPRVKMSLLSLLFLALVFRCELVTQTRAVVFVRLKVIFFPTTKTQKSNTSESTIARTSSMNFWKLRAIRGVVQKRLHCESSRFAHDEKKRVKLFPFEAENCAWIVLCKYRITWDSRPWNNKDILQRNNIPLFFLARVENSEKLWPYIVLRLSVKCNNAQER